jgi:hypothetical protein
VFLAMLADFMRTNQNSQLSSLCNNITEYLNDIFWTYHEVCVSSDAGLASVGSIGVNITLLLQREQIQN